MWKDLGTGSASVKHEIKAPSDIVWNVITDIDSHPSILDVIVSMERLNIRPKPTQQDDGILVGTKWRETRAYNGHEVEQIKTVTSIDIHKDEYGITSRSISIAVTYPKDASVINTSSLTVHSIPSKSKEEKEERCLLVGTFAVVPSKAKDKIRFLLFGRMFMSYARRCFRVELEQLGRKAMTLLLEQSLDVEEQQHHVDDTSTTNTTTEVPLLASHFEFAHPVKRQLRSRRHQEMPQ